MIKYDDGHLLLIQSKKGAAMEPVQDELSADMREAMEHASRPNYSYFAYHHCVCGAKSDATDWILNTGQITNSLAAHYLEYHREEVPRRELEKVREVGDGLRELRPKWAADAEEQRLKRERRL